MEFDITKENTRLVHVVGLFLTEISRLLISPHFKIIITTTIIWTRHRERDSLKATCHPTNTYDMCVCMYITSSSFSTSTSNNYCYRYHPLTQLWLTYLPVIYYTHTARLDIVFVCSRRKSRSIVCVSEFMAFWGGYASYTCIATE